MPEKTDQETEISLTDRPRGSVGLVGLLTPLNTGIPSRFRALMGKEITKFEGCPRA